MQLRLPLPVRLKVSLEFLAMNQRGAADGRLNTVVVNVVSGGMFKTASLLTARSRISSIVPTDTVLLICILCTLECRLLRARVHHELWLCCEWGRVAKLDDANEGRNLTVDHHGVFFDRSS